MRAARDLILVICAVISTACLVYMAINFDSMWADGEFSRDLLGSGGRGTRDR